MQERVKMSFKCHQSLRKWDSKLQWKVIKGNVKLSPLEVDSAACRRGKVKLSFSCGERWIMQHAGER
jgi:hypothetical protein